MQEQLGTVPSGFLRNKIDQKQQLSLSVYLKQFLTPYLIYSYFWPGFDGSAKIIGLVWVCSTSYSSGWVYYPTSNRVK